MSTLDSLQTDTSRTIGKDAIEILENDHNVIREFLSALTDASRLEERSTLFEQMKSFLMIHNATEENFVYPAIRILASRSTDSETLYHQQDEAKVLVWEMDAILKGNLEGRFEESFQQFQKALLAHLRKEETTEFPHLRDALKGEASTILTEEIQEFRSAFTYNIEKLA